MTDRNVPNMNTQIANLTAIVDNIEQRTAATATLVSSEVDDVKNLKAELLALKSDSQNKLVESNDKIVGKIKEKFKEELEEGEQRIIENENACKILQDEIDELYKQIRLVDIEQQNKMVLIRRKLKELEELKLQHKTLKESYSVLEKENENLNNKIDNTKLQNATLEQQIEDMKIVIAKLADARVILNKYFTTHYETFTEEEKRLIAEIEGNIFPEYYKSGLNIPEVKPLTLNTEKKVNNLKESRTFDQSQNQGNYMKPKEESDPFSKQQSYKTLPLGQENYGLNNPSASRKNTNSNTNRNKNQNKFKSGGRIMNAEEYERYQQRLKNEAPPQLSSTNVNPNQIVYSKNVGPDDEYWYEK